MKLLEQLKRFNYDPRLSMCGKITKISGLMLEADGPLISVGSRCNIQNSNGGLIPAEIIGFKDERVILMSYSDSFGIKPGAKVMSDTTGDMIKVSDAMIGRVVDGFGNPIDGKGPITDGKYMSIYNNPIPALSRKIISNPMTTGVKSIDAFITIGTGMRIGIFAGSGVGKSVLMGMITRNTSATVNVIALIGERNKEVPEFIKRDLGEEGLKRSVVVVVTSDESALIRKNGAFVATTIAEYFRDQGKDVMLMMDSLTRFAMAQRDIGLTLGESPTSKGYPTSIPSLLAKLLERAGMSSGDGSITGLYTVLVEGDDMNDPIPDTVRSIVDGHIVLDRALSSQNHYPAVNVLKSASRVMNEVVSSEHSQMAGRFRDLLSTYNESEDLIKIGAYVKGSDAKTDEAINKNTQMINFLKQSRTERFSFEDTEKLLSSIVGRVI